MPGLVDRSRNVPEPTSVRPGSVRGPNPRPVPRHRSPSSMARIRIKNRRKQYLDSHPEYFSSSTLELSGLLLPHYVSFGAQIDGGLITTDDEKTRLHMIAEREAEGKKRGYSGVLEADLWRSEAKIDALSEDGKNGHEMSYRRDVNGEIVAEEKDEVPATKEEGEKRWRKQIELRFLRGDDVDFDYSVVDEADHYDGPEEARDMEEQWFEEEEESFTREGSGSSLKGETGIQDF
ncbi:MAG: hypothetical protein Q9201_003464 [Fulgogasparrea decipioides]